MNNAIVIGLSVAAAVAAIAIGNRIAMGRKILGT